MPIIICWVAGALSMEQEHTDPIVWTDRLYKKLSPASKHSYFWAGVWQFGAVLSTFCPKNLRVAKKSKLMGTDSLRAKSGSYLGRCMEQFGSDQTGIKGSLF